MYLYQYLRIFSFDIHTNPAASETEKKKSEETCRDLLLSLLVSLRSTAHTSACLTCTLPDQMRGTCTPAVDHVSARKPVLLGTASQNLQAGSSYL